MTLMPIKSARRVNTSEPANAPSKPVPLALKLTGSTLRLVFIACLLAITVLVALPQNRVNLDSLRYAG